MSLRSAEAYINRAEANAMLHAQGAGDMQDVFNDIETVQTMRFRKGAAPMLTAGSAEELIQLVRDERRREFCFEGQRWYDLKRTKLFAKQIDHKFTEVNNSGAIMGTELYMLSPNDPNYVYPIPQDELDVNNVIEQNERVEKLPIKEDY